MRFQNYLASTSTNGAWICAFLQQLTVMCFKNYSASLLRTCTQTPNLGDVKYHQSTAPKKTSNAEGSLSVLKCIYNIHVILSTCLHY